MTEDDMNGQLSQHGDHWRLTFTRTLPHRPEKVWRALTESEHLASWFPQQISGGWAPGAKLTFEHAGSPGPPFHGEVIACEPPRLLEFTWGTDTLRFELAPDAAGCTLVLSDTFAELGKAARDAAGWHACLDLLEQSLAGATAPWSSGERWAQVHPGYVAALGPAAATIGPP
jgi:uncharacterized protein YndB with AHSA1/START domain